MKQYRYTVRWTWNPRYWGWGISFADQPYAKVDGPLWSSTWGPLMCDRWLTEEFMRRVWRMNERGNWFRVSNDDLRRCGLEEFVK